MVGSDYSYLLHLRGTDSMRPSIDISWEGIDLMLQAMSIEMEEVEGKHEFWDNIASRTLDGKRKFL